MGEAGHPKRRDDLALAGLSAAWFLLLLLPSLSPHYGFYSDELYYLACADRLALGYVDHPPFFVFVLWLYRELFGDSLFALRALPAAAGASTVFLTGVMARRLGGGLFAQLLAPLSLMIGLTMPIFGFFSVNCLGVLFWTTATWVLLERCRSGEPRLWLALGAVLGLAFLTKHTVLLLVAAIGVATLLTPLRGDLRTRWPWLGALLFLAIAAPNVGWQIANDWPSIAFYRSRAEGSVLSPLQVVAQQIFVHSPAAFPVWAAGAAFFLGSARARPFRALGWVFATLFVANAIGGQTFPYRIAGAYPVAMAGGAVWLEAMRRSGRVRRILISRVLPLLIVVSGGLAASFVLPILSPEVLMRHPLYDGDDVWRKSIGEKRLPYHLGNRTHWQAFVDEVEGVARDLPPAERESAIVLADYFGHAGALEYHGRGRGLPPVYSPMTGYHLWGPPPGNPDPVIAVGIQEEFLRAHYGEVTVAREFRCAYCPRWLDGLPIHVARAPKRPPAAYWPELGGLERMHRYSRLLREQEAKAGDP